MIKFVYLDAGGTLLSPHPSVGEVYAEACRPHGLVAGAAMADDAFRLVWAEEVARGGGVAEIVRGGRDEASTQRLWRPLVESVLLRLGYSGDLNACFAACYEAFSRVTSWKVHEDVEPTLSGLRQRGVGYGILSNWDHRLPDLLRRLGITGPGDPVLVSALEGWHKPQTGFFSLACRRAGLPPGEVAHVGDQIEMDIRPARAAGLHAWRIDRHLTAPESGVLNRLDQILEHLE